MVFLEGNEDPRTDESFQQNCEGYHRTSVSSLLFIWPLINMITHFVLDSVHLGFMGVMKKLLEFWFGVGSRFKVSENFKNEVSRRLVLLRSQIPRGFQRKTRSLLEFCKYKAIELKFFALYAGLVVFYVILPKDLYEIFFIFHHASRLFWCEKNGRTFVLVARNLLQHFITQN